MAFGGTAETYSSWKQLCEPFKEGSVMYILVEHPVWQTEKRVRWYCDKKHNDWMPTRATKVPQYKVFGLSSPSDLIWVMAAGDLTEKEISTYCWKKWRLADFDGNQLWYSPTLDGLEEGFPKDKVKGMPWPDFKALGALAHPESEYWNGVDE